MGIWVRRRCVRTLATITCVALTLLTVYNFHNAEPVEERPVSNIVSHRKDNTPLTPDSWESTIARHRKTNNSTKWLVIGSDIDGACAKLRMRFPDWNILILGTKDRSPDGECMSARADTHSGASQLNIATMKHIIQVGARTVYLASAPFTEGIIPSRSIGEWRANRSVVFRNPDASPILYDPIFAWGCGQIGRRTQLTFSKINYSICVDIKTGITAAVQDSLKHEPQSHPSPTTCDAGSPSVVLEPDVYTMFPAKGIMFNAHALWALPLLHVNDIKIGLIMQKLLWLSGQYVSVRSKPVLKSRPKHSDADVLIEFLGKYVCPDPNASFRDCSKSLLDSLLSQKHMTENGYQIILEWFIFLDEQNYEYPSMVTSNTFSCTHKKLHQHYGRNMKKNLLSPNPINHLNEDVSRFAYKSLCDHESLNISTTAPTVAPWRDVLLIITFNNDMFKPIPYLEMLYRSIFPHILYCFPEGGRTSDRQGNLQNLDLTLVYYRPTVQGQLHGSYFHECAVLAAAMRYDVRGYLAIADDTILVSNNVHKYDRDKLWFLPLKNHVFADYKSNTFTHIGLGKDSVQPITRFKAFTKYEKEVQASLAEVSRMRSKHARSCIRRLKTITGATDRPLSTFPDVWYIPATKIDAVGEIMNVFVEKGCYVAIALATVFDCLSDASDYIDLRSIFAATQTIYHLPGHMNETSIRDNVWEYLHPGNIHEYDVMHPFKLSHVDKREQQHVHYFCRFLDYLHEPRATFVL